MTIWTIVWKSLRQHALSTCVTALCVSLAAGLLMSVWCIDAQSQAAFTGINAGFDAVLGARGSKLQLVLNAIFHLESSPGNLAWADYVEIQKNPNVALAVPLAVGDNYRGYRLVGTTPEFFSKSEYAAGKRFKVAPGGRFFDPTLREAVVGNFVARRLGLKPGHTFHPYHGLIFDEKNQHSETYLVVGVLDPSNTPADRVIWIPLEGVQRMTGHDPSAAEDISAVLVKLKGGSALAGFQMEMRYNKQGNRLTFAWPIGQVIAGLFDKLGWFDRVLRVVCYLVAVVAAGSILAAIYNSINERRREIAILRALGARRATVFAAILLEAAAISALGACAGFAIYGFIMMTASELIRVQTGVVLEIFKFDSVLLWAPGLLIALGTLAGAVPACRAYRIEVAENLAPIS
jgi:putative ABC transport system permease protein